MQLLHRRNRQETITLQEKEPDRLFAPLKDLVGNDLKMYFAMQNFLLQAPRRQIPLLGEVGSLVAKGDAAKANGNGMMARVNYETAAKIEIYNQNKDGARNCLVLAEGVSEKEQQNHEFHETMLADMNEVLRISREYQNFVDPFVPASTI